MKQILLDSTLFCSDNLLPILLGLLGAALLGWLLKHFMGGSAATGDNGLQAKYDQLAADFHAERERYNKLLNDSKKKASKPSGKAEVMSVSAASGTSGMSASEAENLNNKLRNLKEELKQTQDAKINVEGELNAVKLAAKESNALTSEIETLKSRIEGLTRALDTSKSEAEKYKTDYEQANSERSRLSANLSSSDAGALQKRITKLESDLDNSRLNVSTLQAQLDRVTNGPKTAVTADTNKMSNNAEELKSKLASQETEMLKLRAENERLAKANELAGLTKIAAVNEVQSKIATEMGDLKSKLQYAEARASRLEDEKTKLATNVGSSNVVVTAAAPVEAPKAEETATTLVEETKAEEVKAAPVVESIPEPIAAPVAKDDLVVVEGIGPKIAELIHAAGINTYADLADTPVSQLQSILDEAGPAYTAHQPGTWPEQAALLRDGKMDEFKALCLELDGGVRVDRSAEIAEAKAASEAEIAAAKANPDDLKVLEGVGPVLEGVLNSGGVYTYAQLADMTPQEVKAILEAQGDKVHDPASWPKQAKLLRDGKMEEFEALCEQLKGGRF